jgi:hypothetical protein
MAKIAAIIQSNYIPWKGYFDIINFADEFILYDEVQYTKNDWRNRNLIKTPQGLLWLSVPVYHSLCQKINETKISDRSWNKKHWLTISQFYRKSCYYKDYKDFFEELYLGQQEEFLSLINHKFITAVCKLLNIKTKIVFSSEYGLIEGKTERLIDLLKKADANEYISGAAAKNYLNEKLFEDEGIKITWMDYSGYPEYRQLHPPFEHGVSILDLIFNEGPRAGSYMKSFVSKC